jgi:peptidoglycan-N-acetylglucosamine deacetylase
VTATAPRDRYLDALRAVALLRVVVFHMFGSAWLSFVFPAMGVMFALGGSLMAASLRRPTPDAASAAVRGRIRRLLPALWVMGAIVVPAMFWHGWTPDDANGRPLYRLVFWVVPVAEPAGNVWADSATVVLWYLVTYLWLVLLSPLAWRAYRRFPLPTVLLPLAVLVLTQLGPVDPGGPAGDVVVNVATFGACWFVGFAHRTGQLARVNPAVVAALAGCCVAAGAAWALTHPAGDGSLNLNDIPLAQAVYSLGFVLAALRFPPPMGWLARIRPLDAAVTGLNARAVTVYLWHNVAIALAFPLGDAIGVWHLGDAGYFGMALVLLAIAVVGLGWVEDLAARRRPAVLPSLATRRPVKVPAARTASAARHSRPG